MKLKVKKQKHISKIRLCGIEKNQEKIQEAIEKNLKSNSFNKELSTIKNIFKKINIEFSSLLLQA